MLWDYAKEVFVTSIEAAEGGTALIELFLCIAGVLLIDRFKKRPSFLKPLIDLPVFATEERRICTVAISMLIFHVLILAPYHIHQADQRQIQDEKNKANDDYVSENRAYLDAEIVIDSVASDKIYYHFEIANKGKLPATSIIDNENSDGTMYSSGNLEAHDLSPGSKMNLLAGIPRFGNKGGGLHSDLTINYQSKVHGETNNFKARFVFFVSMEMLKPGRFSCDHSELDQSGKADLSLMSHADAVFKLPMGTITFVAPTRIPGTSIPNIFGILGEKRYLVFDGSLNTVVFKTSLLNGSNVIKSVNFSGSSDWAHVVTARWNDTSADLFVDYGKAE